MSDLNEAKQSEITGNDGSSNEFSVVELQTLLPKERVSRLEYRRLKKAAKRKVERQTNAKILIEREAAVQNNTEYQEKMKEVEKDYIIRKQQWEAKEAKYARERARREEVEAVLKAQLAASLGKISTIDPDPVVQLCTVQQNDNVDIPIIESLESSNDSVQVTKHDVLVNKECEAPESSTPAAIKEPCIIFNKTGSCRGGPSCKWDHQDVTKPTQVLVFPHMFSFPVEQEEKPKDSVENVKVLAAFNEFFEDILPEFNQFGGLQDIKVISKRDFILNLTEPRRTI